MNLIEQLESEDGQVTARNANLQTLQLHCRCTIAVLLEQSNHYTSMDLARRDSIPTPVAAARSQPPNGVAQQPIYIFSVWKNFDPA